ncbi:MAG: hypothetical protein ACJ0QM_04235 [Schleiferiaceae bacterium]|jgi:hypothetical protein|nr:MAG: hypothetical protein CBB74_02815 [Owenweeksia sp. TMED14]|tara:strand:- start:14762 stop:15808 length:1047 start_codon:yes stop_codon:yes gene_type:complete
MKLREIFIFCSILFLASSCDNTLVVTSPYENIPIIYGTLNPNSDTQYVRIGKAYLGQDGPNGGLNNPDSLYYSDLIVQLQAFKENGDLFWTKALNQTTDIPKDSGLFTTQGHRLYRIVIPDFISNEKRLDWSYKILLKTDLNSPSFASAETPMVKEFRIKRPNFQGTQRFSFTSSKGAEIQFYQAVNARIYQGYVDFLYMEMPEGSQMDSTRHSVRYNLPYTIGSSLNGGSYLSNSLSYEAFYTFLSEKIPQAPGYIRFFRGFNVHLSAGSDDLATYISVSQPSNTILQDPPFYSNVENGAGIFASRVSLERPNIGLTSASLDSLIFGKLTCPLRFAKASFLDTLTCN